MDALRIVERGDLPPDEMRGPWAGEMGQTQFVPSIYYKYGIDFDGDGRADLIHSVPDVLASSANYLKGLGWRRGEPWLKEVRVPESMDWSQADLNIEHTGRRMGAHGRAAGEWRPRSGRAAGVSSAADGAQRPCLPRLPQFQGLSGVEPVARLFDDGGLSRDADRGRARGISWPWRRAVRL